MDIFELQEFYKSSYPGKEAIFEFDQQCQRLLEIVITDGCPNLIHHVQYNRVKVTLEGEKPKYIPISPHRMNVSWSEIKKFISSKKDIFIHGDEKALLNDLKNNDPESYQNKLSQISEYSGLTIEAIESKLF